jgi:hypothetical protein
MTVTFPFSSQLRVWKGSESAVKVVSAARDRPEARRA